MLAEISTQTGPKNGGHIRILTVVLVYLLAFASPLPAAGRSTPSVGLGMQAVPFPVVGLSLLYKPTDLIGLELIAKTGWDVDVIACRFLYRFAGVAKHRWYAAGMAGFFKDDSVWEKPNGPEEADTGPGFGAGVGLEHFFDSLPNVGWNVELDFLLIDFEERWHKYDYHTPKLLMLGFGAHYYF